MRRHRAASSSSRRQSVNSSRQNAMSHAPGVSAEAPCAVFHKPSPRRRLPAEDTAGTSCHGADRVEFHGHDARPWPLPRGQSISAKAANRGQRLTGSSSRRATSVFVCPHADPPLGPADGAPFTITGATRGRLICAAPGAAGVRQGDSAGSPAAGPGARIVNMALSAASSRPGPPRGGLRAGCSRWCAWPGLPGVAPGAQRWRPAGVSRAGRGSGWPGSGCPGSWPSRRRRGGRGAGRSSGRSRRRGRARPARTAGARPG